MGAALVSLNGKDWTMMHPNGKDEQKIIDIAEARKRQRTLGRANGLAGASVKSQKAGASKFGKNKAPTNSAGSRIWGFVQVILFLALVAYLMQVCQS
jgi:hypothetical protein